MGVILCRVVLLAYVIASVLFVFARTKYHY